MIVMIQKFHGVYLMAINPLSQMIDGGLKLVIHKTWLKLMVDSFEVKWKLLSRVHLFATPCPWYSAGQNTRMSSLSLLQGIFPTQGSNLGLPHCRQIPYQLSHKGSPRILEWVAYPFSSRSSQPRNRTGVSCIALGVR